MRLLRWLWLAVNHLPCAVHGHQPIPETPKDESGKSIPHTLHWRCYRCMAVVGSSEYRPAFQLRASLFQQAKAKRLARAWNQTIERFRRVA